MREFIEEERIKMRKTLKYNLTIGYLCMRIIGCYYLLPVVWIFSSNVDVKLRIETLKREKENIQERPEILFFKPNEN